MAAVKQTNGMVVSPLVHCLVFVADSLFPALLCFAWNAC